MTRPKKKQEANLTSMKIRGLIQCAESVEELAEVMYEADLSPVGFRLHPDDWEDMDLKDLMILETLVVRLRELVELGKLHPGGSSNSSEDLDYDL